ncbi:hypothetical protein QBC35DRAFT_473628 [Podospora australis]|uniref:Uncharacterized protein n=1 Tax=Podospora australis TaxID=1536484 RepID=A0AAN7AH64_9PEZI|nr:hypothetical protein QBC35DRAFT_473628 [Podospora australis]
MCFYLEVSWQCRHLKHNFQRGIHPTYYSTREPDPPMREHLIDNRNPYRCCKSPAWNILCVEYPTIYFIRMPNKCPRCDAFWIKHMEKAPGYLELERCTERLKKEHPDNDGAVAINLMNIRMQIKQNYEEFLRTKRELEPILDDELDNIVQILKKYNARHGADECITNDTICEMDLQNLLDSYMSIYGKKIDYGGLESEMYELLLGPAERKKREKKITPWARPL